MFYGVIMEIGKSLKQNRENRGLSQLQLAKATGLKQQNISRWENDTHIPDVLSCSIIAKYYDITIDELIDIDNVK